MNPTEWRRGRDVLKEEGRGGKMGRQESAAAWVGRGHPQSNKQEGNTAWMQLVCATADQVVLDPTDASRDAEDEDEVS